MPSIKIVRHSLLVTLTDNLFLLLFLFLNENRVLKYQRLNEAECLFIDGIVFCLGREFNHRKEISAERRDQSKGFALREPFHCS